ncbi:MAG: protein kinase [Acidimicrobiales bacterium]
MSDPNAPAPDGFRLASLQDVVEIGRGGFAVVYRAFQPRFGRTVAVKLLDPQGDPRAVERFERECEAMGMLSSHPNIVTIFDAGVTEDGKPYLVMEYMPDGTLDDRLEQEGPRPWEDVVDVGVKLAGALETAHEAGVLHRDVKPANVLCSPFGEPCLSDFGLARFGGQAKTTGVVTATLLHAPPEILGGQPATPRSDVYSLASSLFTLLEGEAPFWRSTDESMLPLLARIADEPVPDLRGRGVPASVSAAIESAMAKEPEDRPLSAAAFGEALRGAQVAEGLTPTPLPLSGRESVAAARRVATAPTDPHDPNATIARSPAPRSDDNRTVAKRAADPPAPAPTPAPPRPKRRRRVLLAVTAVVLVLAVGVAAALTLGGGDDGGGGGAESPAAAGDGGPSSGATLDEMAADVIDLTNDHRADVGLDPVTVDPQLAREAMRHATLAAEVEGYPEANLAAISNRHEGRWGNIFVNTISGPDVESAFEGMLQTRLTRDNLEKSSATVAGVGLAYAEDGTTLYLVEMLAARLSDTSDA